MIASTALVNSLDACKSDLQNRLDGWKEISLYLKRSVRCVQRWERNEYLPVHRHKHLHGMTVYAFRHELDAWWHNVRQNTKSAIIQSESSPPEHTELVSLANCAGARH